jgi:hypothetical protein
MNTSVIIEDTPPRRWLTIAEVCACLKVTEADWNAWRAVGDTPLHIVGPDGQLMIRAADLARWLDARTLQPEHELSPADKAEFRAQRARVARGHGRRLACRWLRRCGGRDGQP